MKPMQKALNKALEQAPQLILENLLKKKLEKLGIKTSKQFLSKLAKHILSEKTEPLQYKSKPDSTVEITIDDNDYEEIERMSSALIDSLPNIIKNSSEKFSKSILNDLKLKWPLEKALLENDLEKFRASLELNWGKPFDELRMLLTISRELLDNTNKKQPKKVGNKRYDLKDILIRLYARACQVTDEIICLLENGFADGAMARWRTLHEISVVAHVLVHFGEDIAKRYIDHHVIESKRAMDKYILCYEPLGYKPIPKKDRVRIENEYKQAINLYGKSFDGDYGWASLHLKSQRPTFSDLEKIVGYSAMRSYCQMANDNIHAGTKSMFFRLGLLDDHTILLAGRSNVGFTDPGQNAAYTLIQISALLNLHEEPCIDDIIHIKVLEHLMNDIPNSFYKVQKQIEKRAASTIKK